MRLAVDSGELHSTATVLAAGGRGLAAPGADPVGLRAQAEQVAPAVPGLAAACGVARWLDAVGAEVLRWSCAIQAHAILVGPGAGASYDTVEHRVRDATGVRG